MKRFIAAVALSAVQAVVACAADAGPSGPFQKNKGLGTWKQVTTGKASPASAEKTTTEATVVSKAALNGWYIETTSDGVYPTKSLLGIDAARPEVLGLWMFMPNNAITLSGKLDTAGKDFRFTGTDQFGNDVELTDKWIDDDHREGTFRLTTKQGDVLIDVTTKLTRK